VAARDLARRLAPALDAGAMALLRRMADGEEPVTADATRLAHAMLDLAQRVDPARAAEPEGLVEVVMRLCKRDDAPLPARFIVVSRLHRLRIPVDLREYRFTQNDVDDLISTLRERLEKAEGDPELVIRAYKNFSHHARKKHPEVAWEAEEEALPLVTPPLRHQWLIARGLTLHDLGRSLEGEACLDEAVRLLEGQEGELLVDALFWRAGVKRALKKPSDGLRDYETSLAMGTRLRVEQNGWVHVGLARCLADLGRWEECLAACAAAQRVAGGGVSRGTTAELEKRAREALAR
jgi:tetratricopeptide (TPR) repeat protein